MRTIQSILAVAIAAQLPLGCASGGLGARSREHNFREHHGAEASHEPSGSAERSRPEPAEPASRATEFGGGHHHRDAPLVPGTPAGLAQGTEP